jgi:mannonate dehydratase
MHIVSADVVVTSPGRNFVTLVVRTSDGLTGYGDATLNGRELAVVSYLRDHVVPLLIARDPQRIEDTWQLLYRGAYWRRGPVTMAAIAAVDMALWDIKGKIAGLPVYQLLGGASRDHLRTYGHANGHDLPELFDSIRSVLAAGYDAVRVQTDIPGLGPAYGTSGAAPDAEGGTPVADAPFVETWDSPAYLRHMPGVFEAVRSEFGPQLTLLHDSHHRLTPIQAARFARDLEPYDLFWLEDLTPTENQEAMRLVRSHSTTPLAIGEVLTSVYDYQTLIADQLIDYVRSAVTHAGGITPLRRIVDFAAQHQVKTGFHGPADISPIGMAAAIHLGLAVHNFGIQEFAPHSEATYRVFPRAYSFEAGRLHPGEQPGLGVSIDLEQAARHPYVRSYLPVNRLTDGTVHDW